jgi:type I restriction enzyme M protein
MPSALIVATRNGRSRCARFRLRTAEVKGNDCNLNIRRYVDSFEAEEGVDSEQMAAALKTLETAINETDKAIADDCRQLNISTPF